MESGARAKPELVLVERITRSEGGHVIPDILAAQIELLGAVGMGREIEVDIQLLIFDPTLKHVRCSTDTEDQWQRKTSGVEVRRNRAGDRIRPRIRSGDRKRVTAKVSVRT